MTNKGSKDGNKGQGIVPSSFCPQSLVGHLLEIVFE